jgi:LacI family transcriptional regulator, gluconate utilization system Gnt-I transcriptional repressor
VSKKPPPGNGSLSVIRKDTAAKLRVAGISKETKRSAGKKPRRRSDEFPVTLADVAREGRVSEITVSRVVRNRGAISEQMRERVEAAIKKVGYLPNRLAGSLASAGSDLIGVIMPTLKSAVFHLVLKGVNESIAPAGYRAVVGTTEFRADEEERLVKSLLSWRPAAMIIAAFDHTPETAEQLQTSRARLVEITDIERQPIGVSIGISHWCAGRDMGRYLLSRGYRRFGYVAHDIQADRYAQRRYDGFRHSLNEAGLEVVAERILAEPLGVAVGKAATGDLLRGKRKIDAVYFSNDEMAIGGYFHCLEAAIEVPRRLALAGFNGGELGQALPLPLTTILSNWNGFGQLAGEYALALIAGKSIQTITDVGFTLIEGATA